MITLVFKIYPVMKQISYNTYYDGKLIKQVPYGGEGTAFWLFRFKGDKEYYEKNRGN